MTGISIDHNIYQKSGKVPSFFQVECAEAATIYQELLSGELTLDRGIKLGLHRHTPVHEAVCPLSRQSADDLDEAMTRHFQSKDQADEQ